MFKTTVDFYQWAYALANEEEEQLIIPYMVNAVERQSNPKPISQMEDSAGNAIPLREETEDIKRQRRTLERTLDAKIEKLNESEPIEGMTSIQEMDFRLRQELVRAGWILTETEGKVVIYSYLPTLHQK